MKLGRVFIFVMVALGLVILGLRVLRTGSGEAAGRSGLGADRADINHVVPESASTTQAAVTPLEPAAQPQPAAAEGEPPIAAPQAPAGVPDLITATDPLERLHQAREIFQGLAAGNPTNALLAAKQIVNPNEREAALLSLISEWTGGELRSPTERARAIAQYGLEAGLGIELAGNPELAVLWANEMTSGPGRAAILQETARHALETDPAIAFALAEQFPENQRDSFKQTLYAGWAGKDTEAALNWANHIVDAAERETALQAIRNTAPVGIGAAMAMRDGYPVVINLLPGTPAQLSGQIGPGDRILGIAQGDSAFVPAQGLQLSEIVRQIRGTPGSVLQLQIQSAGAPPNSPPRTVSIVRDQIKFKQ